MLRVQIAGSQKSGVLIFHLPTSDFFFQAPKQFPEVLPSEKN